MSRPKWIYRVYVDLMIFLGIWSEHFLIDKEQQSFGEFFYFKYLSRRGLQCNLLPIFFDSGTWQIYKKVTNRNKRKCWHRSRDWCFVINTAQFFCINHRISYPINSQERQLVLLQLTASAAFGKQKWKQNKIVSCFTFYNLSTDI